MVTDNNGDLYLMNVTKRDTGIATPGTHQQLFGGEIDIALTKWEASGSKVWGTYYGGELVETLRFGTPNIINVDAFPEYSALSMDDEGQLLNVGQANGNDGIQVGCTYTPAVPIPRVLDL